MSAADFTRASILTAEVEEAIDDSFGFHEMTHEQQIAGAKVRMDLATAAKTIVACVPPCGDRTVALQAIRDARMWANSAIANKGRF